VPKRVHKLDQFHGGLNSNADPRDIADNELSAATDIMVDELGKIRSIGGSAAHASETGVGSIAHTNEITPGYGLYAWNSDRTAANVTISDYSGTHTGGDSDTAMVDGSGSFPLDTLIGATINNITDGSSGVITDNNATYVIVAALTGGSDNSWDDSANDAYTISNIPTTGANYLAFSDSDSTGTVMIYDMGSDSWGSPIIGQTDAAAGRMRKDVFYASDGDLRICDSEFKNSNTNKWHGYVDRIFMASASGSETTVDYWTTQPQYIIEPGSNSAWDDIVTPAITSEETTYTTTSTGIDAAITSAGTMYYFEDGTALNAKSGAITNIYKMIINVRVVYDRDRAEWEYTLTAGDATNSTTPAGSLGTNHKSTEVFDTGSVDYDNVVQDDEHTFTFAIGDTGIADEGTTGAIVKLQASIMTDVDSIDITSVTIIEGSTSGDPHHGVGGSDLTTNEVFVEADFEATTGALGWGKKWEHGFTFIYDEKQESLVRRIEKVDASGTNAGTSPPTYLQDNTANPAHAPNVRISVPYDSVWNPRITGGVWYIRDVSGDVPSKWWAQAECNFVSGTIKVLQSGVEYDAVFNPTTSEFNFDIDHENLLQPNQTDTYFSRNGFREDSDSLSAKFKSVVQVGRRVYVGNVQILKDDGTKEVKGDAIIKSPVNRFDTFPSSSLIEAAVNDGESITALEEFADRILQFKEQTLYIINVSQDIEFLEDVYKHKGVLLPAAVCKTDYGCAWVNRLGCYLYDGKKVIDLLEKGGRQIIKESDWLSFTTDNSIIGYIPKKRQLIVLKDCSGSSVGDIFLYDMVTQSWVQGDSAFTDSQEHTNFVNDSNGDLVWSHTSDTGTMRVWADASVTTTGISFKTKDLDFGQPAQRKKIYKAYVSYKGDGGAITVNYGTDGNSTMAGTFYITGVTGASTKAGAHNLCLYDGDVGTNDWVLAELIPSSSINNIDSFRLSFDGGTTDANFEINDISVIYRMKNLK
jgi:hypothetical protein